jgi:hypothetical protein
MSVEEGESGEGLGGGGQQGGGGGRWSQRHGGGCGGAGACGVDLTAVGEATAVQAWRRLRSGCAADGEMIVARVGVYGRVALH